MTDLAASMSLPIGDLVDISGADQLEPADPRAHIAAVPDHRPRTRRPRPGILFGHATLGNILTVGLGLVAVVAVLACDWWLATLVFAGAERADAWVKLHAGVSMVQITLSVLTLIVAGLTVAGVLDPRRRHVG